MAHIHYCASVADTGRLREVLASNPKLANRKGSRKQSPLHFAAEAGRLGAIRVLVEHGHAQVPDQFLLKVPFDCNKHIRCLALVFNGVVELKDIVSCGKEFLPL